MGTFLCFGVCLVVVGVVMWGGCRRIVFVYDDDVCVYMCCFVCVLLLILML